MSLADIRVDGRRVDDLIHQLGEAFRDGPRRSDGTYSHLDSRDWRDFALMYTADGYDEDDGGSPLWDAVSSLLAPSNEMDDWGMRDAVVRLVNALDRCVPEGESLAMSDLRVVKAALRDLNAAVDRWQGEAP